MNIIETKNLTKIYRGTKFKALDNLNLEVNEGEIFGFIGPNGAGKTTTIRLFLDLIRPTKGSAKIFGLDINKNSVAIRQEIGFLPGEIFLPENFTGKSCIDYYKRFKKNVDEKYLKSLTDSLEFGVNKKIREYSKGNRQKLSIILALMHKPKLLFLDEPTSGLDPLNQQIFYKLMMESKRNGSTIFLSTHLLVEAQNTCDRVGIIKDGKLLSIENIDDFRQKNIREIHLETKKTIPLSDLKIPGVQKIERTTYGYHLITVGLNGEIIKKIAQFPIDDIKIYEPSLEEIFMHYYK
jgi:ABC-2 type transport system ATP-binding protein